MLALVVILMVLSNLKNRKCPICNKRGDKVKKDNIFEVKNESVRSSIVSYFKQPVNVGDIVCKKHLHTMKRNKDDDLSIYLVDENNNQIQDEIPIIPNDETLMLCEINHNETIAINDEKFNSNTITVSIPRTISSHSICFICKTNSGKIKLKAINILL